MVTLYRDEYRIESARHPGWDYRLPGWYFVTICTRDKYCYFGEVRDGVMNLSQTGQIAKSALQNIASHYLNLQLDAFVVMPNHVHAIVVLEGSHRYTPDKAANCKSPVAAVAKSTSKTVSLAEVVGSYKADSD